MSAAEKLNTDNVVQLKPGKWVNKALIKQMYGFTEDQLKKYRAGLWLEGKHFRKNPANTLVYSPEQIDRWMEGKF